MLKHIEGSRGVAEAVALCRPEIICAYPITPQTHIVEDLGAMVKGGRLERCEFINVESEFAALSVAIGSCATGARSYTATASQGLLFMAEAVYNASGLGLPIVMTVGNRAIGAPINIWNDQSDSMALRDAGWIQLYAESNQQAVDVHMTLHGSALPIYSVIAGLGGRPITRKSLRKLFQKAMVDDLDQTEFLDLKWDVVKRELERERKLTRSGSIAENILRDMGVVDAAKTA